MLGFHIVDNVVVVFLLNVDCFFLHVQCVVVLRASVYLLAFLRASVLLATRASMRGAWRES